MSKASIELYDLSQAIEHVSSVLERPFKSIKCKFPKVLGNNSRIEFADSITGHVLAKFKIHMVNQLKIVENQLYMPMMFTEPSIGEDLDFSTISINLDKPAEESSAPLEKIPESSEE